MKNETHTTTESVINGIPVIMESFSRKLEFMDIPKVDEFTEWFWSEYDKLMDNENIRPVAQKIHKICKLLRTMYPNVPFTEMVIGVMVAFTWAIVAICFWFPSQTQIAVAVMWLLISPDNWYFPVGIIALAMQKMMKRNEITSRRRSGSLGVLSMLLIASSIVVHNLGFGLGTVLSCAMLGCLGLLTSGLEYFRGHSMNQVNIYMSSAAMFTGFCLAMFALSHTSTASAWISCSTRTMSAAEFQRCWTYKEHEYAEDLTDFIETSKYERASRRRSVHGNIEAGQQVLKALSSMWGFSPGLWDIRTLTLLVLGLSTTMLPGLVRNVAADIRNDAQRSRADKRKNAAPNDKLNLNTTEILTQMDGLEIVMTLMGATIQYFLVPSVSLYLLLACIIAVAYTLALFHALVKRGLERDGANADLLQEATLNTHDGLPLITGLAKSSSARRALNNTIIASYAATGGLIGWHLGEIVGVSQAPLVGVLLGACVAAGSFFEPKALKYVGFFGASYAMSVSGAWLIGPMYLVTTVYQRHNMSLNTSQASSKAGEVKEVEVLMNN